MSMRSPCPTGTTRPRCGWSPSAVSRSARPAYPATMPMRFDALDVTLPVYEGTVDIAVPGYGAGRAASRRVTQPASETVDLNIVVDYQTCSDTICYLPEEARLTLSVPKAGLLGS